MYTNPEPLALANDSTGRSPVDDFVDLSIRLRSVVRTIVDVARAANENHQELEVLVLLQRRGMPYRMHVGELTQALHITSGALTGRMDNLERSGFLSRQQDPRDRRQAYVTLTREGLRRVTAARNSFGDADVSRVRNAVTGPYGP